ncbi:uncharacterized protein LOC116415694 isoform X1 [Nasonia vitripennis]|uniref:MADF domain-containing protein n=2 Tax=Nasonia vitripennis TaxID=7425 RepID=A0A7M7QRD8_NASVI|nr:uncharacterized protein LOC116415694 isoform X1 [Nasonia vitripennis]
MAERKNKSESIPPKKLVALVKGYPCLYDRNNHDYNDNRKKHECFNEIANSLNNSSGSKSFTGDCVKSKWESLRRSYSRGTNTNSNTNGYYLAKEMDFLAPHMKKKKVEKDKEVDEVVGEDLHYEDVLRVMKYKNETAVKIEPSTNTNIKENLQIETAGIKDNIPAPSTSYVKKKNVLENLENQCLKVATAGMKEITNLMNSDTNSSTNDNCYLLPIEEALKDISPGDLLSCTNEILCIIDTFLPDTITRRHFSIKSIIIQFFG